MSHSKFAPVLARVIEFTTEGFEVTPEGFEVTPEGFEVTPEGFVVERVLD